MTKKISIQFLKQGQLLLDGGEEFIVIGLFGFGLETLCEVFGSEDGLVFLRLLFTVYDLIELLL